MATLEAKRTRSSQKSPRDIGEAARFWHEGEFSRLPDHILDQRVPKLPASVNADELRLLPRTRNSLMNAGLLNSLKSLEGLTVRELVQVRSFGAKSLADLIRALCTLLPRGEATRKPSRAAHSALLREARKLRDTKYGEVVCKDDPRFRSVLWEIDYKARDARHAAERIIFGAYKPCDPATIAKLVSELTRQINSLSKLKLEDELWDLTCVVRNKRDRRIALRRFGWDGKEPASLRVTGDSFGVSYEYVRVICNRIVQAFNGKSVFAPALDRVLEFIANRAEQSEHLGENELLSTGLVRKRFSLMSLISAAGILGRDSGVELLLEMGRPGTPSEGEAVRRQALSATRHCLRSWGVTLVAKVRSHLGHMTRNDIDSDAMAHVLTELPGFRWLDPTTGWFCLDPKDTPLASRLKKALAVARRLPVSDLREATARHRYRAKSLDIPSHVLLEFCRQFPWCHVEGDHVIGDSTLRRKDVLAESEKIIAGFQEARSHSFVGQDKRLMRSSRDEIQNC